MRAARSLRVTPSLVVLATCFCGGSADAPATERALVVDGGRAFTATTDLGFEVSLDRARAVVASVQLTAGGETHASLLAPLSAALLPQAYAHPGHEAGGDVLGELAGRLVIDFVRDHGAALGAATLLFGEYDGANVTLGKANADDVAGDDPLLGHSFELAGVAVKDGVEVPFVALVDQDEGRRVLGAPFAAAIAEDDGPALGLALRLTSDDGATAFDGIDFSAHAPGDDGVVVLRADDDAGARLKRALQRHEYWAVNVQGGDES